MHGLREIVTLLRGGGASLASSPPFSRSRLTPTGVVATGGELLILIDRNSDHGYDAIIAEPWPGLSSKGGTEWKGVGWIERLLS